MEYSAAGAVVYALIEYSGTLAVGGTDATVGLRDILITGYDPLLGTLKWSLPLGSVSNDSVLASAVDSSGNLVFAASHRAPITRGITPAEGTLSGLGTMLASVSPAGKLLWAMDLSDLTVVDLAVAPGGDIYAVGNTRDALITQTQTLLPDSVDGFLLKLSWL